MHKKHTAIIFLALVALFLASFFVKKNSSLSVTTPASPTASASATPIPTPIMYECVDDTDISQVTGKTYDLQRQTTTPELSLTECTYKTAELAKGINRSVHYLIYNVHDTSFWDAKKNYLINQPGFRRIEGKDDYFAQINPVLEVSQGSFFGKTNDKYIELYYTPVDEQVGVMLDKGVKLLDSILLQVTKLPPGTDK